MGKMNWIFILALLTHYAEPRIVSENCQNAMNYNKTGQEVIKNNIDSPYQLAMDYDRNTLFFSYNRVNNGISTFESAFIDLTTNEFKIVNGIEGGFANGVDRDNNIVYLGGQDGLYTFDYDTGLAKHLDGSSHKIWQIFHKHDLYYTKYPEEEVYIFKDGKPQRVQQLLHTRGMLIGVDISDNIYFANSSGLFIYQENSNVSSNFISYVGDYNINGFTSDIKGNLFFSTPNGIFFIDNQNKTVEQLVSLDDVYGVAVERDGSLIYASNDSIIRLKKILC